MKFILEHSLFILVFLGLQIFTFVVLLYEMWQYKKDYKPNQNNEE